MILLFSYGLLGASQSILAALLEQNPVWLMLAGILGIGGTLATTYRPTRTAETQVALDGMHDLVVSLQAELIRLRIRVAYLEKVCEDNGLGG